MVLPILIPAAASWPSDWAFQLPVRGRFANRWGNPSNRRGRPRWRPRLPDSSRQALASHWAAVAMRCVPAPQPPIVPNARAGAGSRDLLARCEASLLLLLRHRRRALALSAGELDRVATTFDGRTLRAQAQSSASTAFVLVSMYWCGCRHPMSLLLPPLHPPTGLVRWLAGFSVHDQVAHGRILFDRLAQEERRIFGFALRLVERMRAMGGSHDRGVPLLPELLRLAEPHGCTDWSMFTTFT